MEKFDVVEVNMETSVVKMMGFNKDEKNAEAILKFALMRRGGDDVFYSVEPAGIYRDGDKFK